MDQFFEFGDGSRDPYASYESFAFESSGGLGGGGNMPMGMEGGIYRGGPNHASMEGSGMEELSDRGHSMPPHNPPAQYHPAQQMYHTRADPAQHAHSMHGRTGFEYHERSPMPDQHRHPSPQHSRRAVAVESLAPPPAPSGGGKRAREEKAPASDSTSSKRSRAEKHYKEIRLLCDALAPHIADVNCNERAVRMYDKYRDSGKAAGRPSRPMYAAVVLAMSGEEDEEGDESDCKQRLQLVASASTSVWGNDAPDKRKIWDSLIVLLRIVPLRCPQDNLAGSVLTRLFRSIKFSSVQQHHEMTKQLLIKLATTLEQGPLAGKAPKTVAACTMHLYCRHSSVGLTVARTIANSLQVGESTVRTNLRGIYVNGGLGGVQSAQLLSDDAQDLLDMCPQPSDFELNLPGSGGRVVAEGAPPEGSRSNMAALASMGADGMAAIQGSGGGAAGRGGRWATPLVAARESMYSNPPPLVSTPNMPGGSSGMSCHSAQSASSHASQSSHPSHASQARPYAAQGSGFQMGMEPHGGYQVHGGGFEGRGMVPNSMPDVSYGKSMGPGHQDYYHSNYEEL